ncbi:heavy metal translocating P-type ATPase [Parapusillimonas granuli]|uniref:P-type Zn(2+) transporter n=1 Tax=Parapusillimonas granuli TaxID=380911 RepID=A0A853G1D8_9BURK|nr:heavy metal translocating P-type ATPase [Parapusillimonas granuli]MBB5213427.1 Cd2+/Zn2+-exporting ATPase [Parapusillimonas granuli]NYT48266.1 heavy metal translocating P-type ATPase [Parapusillimonas granuli]
MTIRHLHSHAPAHQDAVPAQAAPCCGHDHAAAARKRGGWWPLALAGVLALLAEALHWLGEPSWMQALPAGLAVILGGAGTYKKGWIAIARGNLNINALMSIAVTGAFALGQWPEAAMVMVLFSIAEYIEAASLGRARHAIEHLLKLAPDTVRAQAADGSWHSVPARGVAVGTRLRVAPGERIGLDGRVEAGYSTVDQAPITGESMPVEKREGDLVYAGTVNGMGELEYVALAAFDHTTLARIVDAVSKAQGAKAHTQRFMDRFARVYTPAVCLLALAVAVLPPVFLGGGWQDWIYRALVLLVIACPCALVISTPIAIVSGLTAAARHGVLVKGGVYLEQGRKLAWVALDKTGTLTRGEPRLTDAVELQAGGRAPSLRIAAGLARRSGHPVAQAIGRAWEHEAPEVQAVQATPGGGIEGRIAGRLYLLGSPSWVGARAGVAPSGEAAARLDALQAQGKSVSVLADEGAVLAAFAVADTVRDSSRQAVAELHRLGVRTAMLTGDNAATAAGIAREVGIDAVHAGLLPQDKLDAIVRYGAEGVTGMVGDGINDAPALARADIGFAMAAMGTDTAMETADVALMDDDLRKLPRFIALSRATHAVLVQNIVLALGIKAVFLALTVAGLGTMWMAVFADVGASLLVIGNSLRLLRK